jgi:hypothetical protein
MNLGHVRAVVQFGIHVAPRVVVVLTTADRPLRPQTCPHPVGVRS